ncbi:hypothetical protein OHA37_22225 [Streptomyces sp. NBC_00335]|uniref:hypothetical protein n=1 Tax=unclassified Streptomyces TaxID=2593676 RepID=UPI00224D22DC|nr:MULTISPECIES: hypothetical protein [unclassified Streptomyces]MCX5406578.1 hypothetical protein [Streptomyces sp. NBC_00086]
MPAVRATTWVRHQVTEFRIACVLSIVGALTTLVGVALYAIPGAGFPPVAIGLSCLTTGMVMLGSGVKDR